MLTLFIIFVSLTILEVLCLIGIFMASRRLDRWKVLLQDARIVVLNIRSEVSRSLKQGHITVKKVNQLSGLVYQCLPLWAKAGITVLRWVGKIKPQIS